MTCELPMMAAAVGDLEARVVRDPRKPDALPCPLQLLGWVGWLGLGYAAWGRVLVGTVMTIGWSAVFWALLFVTLVTQTLTQPLAILVWVLVPPISSLPLLFAATTSTAGNSPFPPP